MKSKIAIALTLLPLCFSGCYYDKYNELHPLDGYVDTCDPSLPDTYGSVVKNIVLLNCVSCHNSNTNNGNVTLETYDNVKQYVENGSFMGSVLHQNGYQAMPPGVKLQDCDVQQLQQWIANGMPQ
jgi:mono/diheme cytochrome c family protein